MLRRLHTWAAALAAALCMASCGGVTGEQYSLDLSFASPEVSADPGQVFVRVSSDAAWTLEISGDAPWANLSLTSGTGNKNSIILKYEANPADDPRTLEITARAGKTVKTATLTQKGRAVAVVTEGAGRYSAAPFAWLELPETSRTDRYEFLYHSFQQGDKTVRNFSYYWDFDNLVAHWVAYPLNSSLIGSGSRTDAWNLEPLLSTSEQPVLVRGFSEGNNGWYARGHQCPSADRLLYESNVQTFYGTNMTPQNNDFNGKIWANLEKNVRNWAKSSDTLYVVTGCTLDGAKYYALDNYGKRVTVPTGYFKAVLRYSKTSTVGHGGYMGCAVFLEHRTYSTDVVGKSMSMSIDALEQKLGIDLFVNLPSVVGKDLADQIEAEDPAKISWWW